MKLAIHYRATYQYEEKASFSPHIVRLFPRQDLSVSVDRMTFSTHASADVQNRQDLFNNLIAYCFYPEKLDCLDYHLDITLTVQEKNAFHFLVDAHALKLPFAYKDEEAVVLAPYLVPQNPLGSLPAALDLASGSIGTVDALIAANDWLHANIEYERRDEGDPYPPQQTLDQARGSCRDYAVLLVEVLRKWGLASRLVSGFLWESSEPNSPRRAENALHAWVETYVPGAGWLGLDPTNGVFCDHQFLATAVGLTHAQIAPVEGHYYGKKTIASTLVTKLLINEETE